MFQSCLFACVYIVAVWIVQSVNNVHNTLVVINLADTSFRPVMEPDRKHAHNKLQFITNTHNKSPLQGVPKYLLKYPGDFGGNAHRGTR